MSDKNTQKPKKSSATPIVSSDSLTRRTRTGDKKTDGKQDNSFAISVIDDMAQLFFASAGTIYHRLKDGLHITESFFVPGEDSHYKALMDVTASKILDFIEKICAEGIFSVSMCFTANDVKNKDSGQVREGFWAPYCFKSSNGSNLTTGPNTKIPVRGKFNNDGEWEYDKGSVKEKSDKISMPHGGISFSERFINKIDKCSVDGEDVIIGVDRYDLNDKGYFVANGEEIDSLFNDGANGKDANGDYIYRVTNILIRYRSQVVIIPIECKENQTGGKPKRIGYLQVTGYNYSVDSNKNKFVNSDKAIGKVYDSKILKDNDNDKLIISTLKCYANYIVLTNKIEAVKKLSADIKTTVKITEVKTTTQEVVGYKYVYGSTEEEKH